jgi:hypothetical protein
VIACALCSILILALEMFFKASAHWVLITELTEFRASNRAKVRRDMINR